MGVTGLWKLIEQSGKPVPLDTLENKILAVDISIWLHQVVKGFQDSNGASLQNAHLLGLFHRLCKLLYYRIKPVIVFDGGVAPLKRETIAKRARNKNKYQNEADKLQHLLLEALAKEKVVQQALGPSTSALLTNSSPKKVIKKTGEEAEDDLFKLPPLNEDTIQNTDDSLTDLTESDSSFDEKHRTQYNHNLQSIDVGSSYFQSLPADIRHEILSDIKETRKQSSWGRLHELPAESQSFSNFQMKRLLKRRQVQVELEEAEKEMGGKGLSMAELETLLSEEGVVDADLATERIASNEHVRYLHVRDITKAMKKEADEEVKTKLKDIKIEPEILEDIDLQRAIQLSLDPDFEIKSTSDLEDETLKLTVEQRKALASTATSLARTYMIEYGGLNDDDISDLVKLDETVHPTTEFRFNDESIVGCNIERADSIKSSRVLTEKSEKCKAEEKIEIDHNSTEDSMSSDADSDFIDVPEVDSDIDNIFVSNSKAPLPTPFLMNEPPTIQNEMNTTVPSEIKKIEVLIDTNVMCDDKDDIFADIFEPPSLTTTNDSRNQSDQSYSEQEVSKIEIRKISNDVGLPLANKMKDEKMKRILNELDNEISTVTSLNLNNLLEFKTNENMEKDSKKFGDVTIVDDIIMEKDSKEPSTPPKIPQPFFVQKTPPSSKKKLSASVNSPTASIATNSLHDTFSSLPTLTAVPQPEKLNERETLSKAADVLREQKSKQELEKIADQLSQERREIATEMNKKDRLGVSITEQMSMECMELLRLFGVPFIVAPMEAEAQCAYLNEIHLTDGTITDDSDIWLFGGQTVYKNFFDQNKLVMEYKSNNIETLFHLDRRKLIQLSFLVGSDYTQGIHGIGAVTALEVLSIFGTTPEKDGETTEIMSTLSSLRKFRDWWHHKNVTQRTIALRNKLKNITFTEDFPNPRVAEAYLFPTVDENRERFTWGQPELESIREYAKKTFGWTKKRTDEIILPVMKRLSEKISQKSIQNYFKITEVTSRKELKVSKRVRSALELMSADPDEKEKKEREEEEADLDEVVNVIVEKKAKRKPSKTPKNNVSTGKEKKTTKINRKRKPEHHLSQLDEAFIDEPSTSTGIKRVVLPDNNQPIPQREKDKEIMENNKMKAIQIIKTSKK